MSTGWRAEKGNWRGAQQAVQAEGVSEERCVAHDPTSGAGHASFADQRSWQSGLTEEIHTLVRVDDIAGYNDPSSPGDSGVPWFSAYDAYGTHVGSPAGDANDAFYMAVNYISRGIHVDVLTSP